MKVEAERVIAALRLEPLPQEGGFFRPTWRSAEGSAILFLITPEHFSALHRLAQDELWHFHDGDPVEHVRLDPRDGSARVTRVGAAVLAGEAPQLFVPRGVWQGARVLAGERGFALLSCTVTPPWDERGFELGAREELRRTFPAEAARIGALTR